MCIGSCRHHRVGCVRDGGVLMQDYTDLLGAILLALAVVAGGWLWVVLIGSLI